MPQPYELQDLFNFHFNRQGYPADVNSVGLAGQRAVKGQRGGHWLVGPVPQYWRLAARGARGLVALARKIHDCGEARSPLTPRRMCSRTCGLTRMIRGIVAFITVIVASCIQCCSLSVQSIPAFAEFAFVLLAFAGSLAPWRSLQRLDLTGVSYNGHEHKEAQCIEASSASGFL